MNHLLEVEALEMAKRQGIVYFFFEGFRISLDSLYNPEGCTGKVQMCRMSGGYPKASTGGQEPVESKGKSASLDHFRSNRN